MARMMVPADQEDRVAKVEEGEIIELPRQQGEPREDRAVEAKCAANNGRWYCATHRESFANQLQKDIHIHSGKHRMAWICFTHDIEVP